MKIVGAIFLFLNYGVSQNISWFLISYLWMYDDQKYMFNAKLVKISWVVLMVDPRHGHTDIRNCLKTFVSGSGNPKIDYTQRKLEINIVLEITKLRYFLKYVRR